MRDFEVFTGPTSSRFSTIRFVNETGSTNSDLMEEAQGGAAEGSVIMAKRQKKGRGRQGRSWQGDSGEAMMMSFLVRPATYEPGLLPLFAGLAVVAAVSKFGLRVGLKWPNDVLVSSHGERKLAGILAEAGTGPDGLFVVVGIGLNLKLSENQVQAVGQRAIGWSELNGMVPSAAELCVAVLGEMEQILVAMESGESSKLLDQYREICLSVGRESRFVGPTGEVSGWVESVADDGSLMIRTELGLESFSAGDLHHLESGPSRTARADHRPD